MFLQYIIKSALGYFSTITFCLLISVQFLLSTQVFAAPPTPAQLQELQRNADTINQQEQLRQQELLREQQLNRRPPGTVDTGIEKMPAGVGAPGQCFDVHTIILDGAINLTPEEITSLTSPFTDKCIGLFEIKELLRTITNFYIDKGFVTTRAYIPQQDLSSGTLKLLIVEGVTESIDVTSESAGINLAKAFPWVKGKVLNIRDIEQGLDQINRLQSNNATMELKPGKTPGLTSILVSNTPGSRFSGNVSVDNQGSESQGEFRGTAMVGIDNLLGLNDYWSFSLTHNLDDDSGDGLSRTMLLSFSIPHGYWTFSGSHSQFNYESITRSLTQSFRGRGETLNTNFGISRVLHRGQTYKVTFSTGLTHTDTKNYIEDSLLTTSSRRLTVAKANLTAVFAGLGGSWTVDGGIENGIDWFGSEELPNYGHDTVPTGLFTKAVFSASYATPFKVASMNASFSSSLQAQYSPDYMVSTAKISVGGLHTVRGYDDTSLSGDKGYYLRNDLALNLVPFTDPTLAKWLGGLQPYFAVDIGRIFGREGQMPGTLAGRGVGLRSRGGLINFDIFYGKPMSYSESVRQAFNIDNHALYFKIGVSI